MSNSNKHGGVRDGAGRPKSEPTKMMRIPIGAELLVKHLISVYKNLDHDVINDVLERASRYPELEANAVLLQIGDLSHFTHGRRLRQHLMNTHGVIIELDEQQQDLQL
jgi:hypothetical protein